MKRAALTPAQRKRRNDYMRVYMRVYMRKRYRRLKLEEGRRRRRPWSAEELEWLHHAFPNQKTTSLAIAMGRSVNAVYDAAHLHGIRKSAEWYAGECSGRMNIAHHGGRAHRFPKGHVPANKGMRRPGWAPGRMATTQFKKGGQNHNAMPLGSTRIVDGYLYLKVAEVMYVPYTVNWKPLHMLNWERANGRPVPPGHCLAFRDGDRMNVEPENVELLTRAQNMARNTIHNLPAPLKEVIRLRGTIMATITKREKKREKQNRGPAQPPVRDARGAEGQGKAHGDRPREGDRGSRQRDRPVGEGRG